MRINVEFNTVEEMQEFAKLIGTPCKCSGETIAVAPVVEEEVKKDNSKSDKRNGSKKSENAKSEAEKPREEKTDKKKETEKGDAPKVEVEQVGEPEPIVEEPPKDVEPSKEEPKVTKEQLREICATVMKSGKQSEVKEVFKKYGATKLPELKEKDYAAAYKDVEALQ